MYLAYHQWLHLSCHVHLETVIMMQSILHNIIAYVYTCMQRALSYLRLRGYAQLDERLSCKYTVELTIGLLLTGVNVVTG